jgi:hypothetical protein
VRGRGIVVCFAVVQGEDGEDGEEEEGEPDGEGNEDCVDETGCRDWRGEGGVCALEMEVSCLFGGFARLVEGIRRREEGTGWEGRTKPSGRFVQSIVAFILLFVVVGLLVR